MSVTFSSDAVCPALTIREACLCAQLAPNFMRASEAVLARHASPDCAWCLGSGIEERQERTEPTLNVSNVNAHALLAFLRLADDGAYLLGLVPKLGEVRADSNPTSRHELIGELELPLMRRALLRGRNTFERRAPHFVRSNERLRAAFRHPDGTTEIRDRVRSQGLRLERLARYLTALERLCAFAAEHGGTLVRWS